MKLKSSLFIVAASVGFVASASALTIDIVGSTAGRSAVIPNVEALIAPVTYKAFNGSSDIGSNQLILKGTYASAPITVRFNFTGSALGVQQVSQQVSTVQFYRETLSDAGSFPAGGQVPFPGTSNANISTSAPEIGYSDVFQSTTQFKTPPLTTEENVAIIPFKFFRNKGSNTALTNITSQQARSLYGVSGDAKLSLFTGNIAHDSITVYATGRDALSGTRITTFAETAASQTAINQYNPTINGTGVPPLFNPANTGFSRGSEVKAVINGTSDSDKIIVGYLGSSDWTTDTDNTTGRSLSFNGVTYSVPALRKGQYTFWGYLHQFTQGTGSAAFNTALKNAIIASPGLNNSGLETLLDMECTRSADGAVVVPSGGA